MTAVENAEQPFDVILLDFRLPDSADLNLLGRLRAMTPTTRVIMMTAFGMSDLFEEAIHLGAARVVDKPFEMTEMVRFVDEAQDAD